MRNGELSEGEAVFCAKIDMASPNVHMRDPILYRVLHSEHHQTGNKWKIYPMYDYAHPLSDAIEGITHSLLWNSRTIVRFMIGSSRKSTHPLYRASMNLAV